MRNDDEQQYEAMEVTFRDSYQNEQQDNQENYEE